MSHMIKIKNVFSNKIRDCATNTVRATTISIYTIFCYSPKVYESNCLVVNTSKV